MSLSAVDYTAPDAARQFVESLRTTGFGVLKNHPIDQALVDSIYQHWQEFFATDDKFNYAYDREKQDGFFSMSQAETAKNFAARDIKEYFHFYPWGRCPPSLRAELQTYFDAAHRFAAELLSWIEQLSPPAVAAGYSEPLSGMIDDSDQTLLRILHYPPLTGSEAPDAVRAAAHEDINLITILPAASVTGLQVLGSDGRWIDVPCEFENIIINTGDMLQEASGGYFVSTKHRVINPPGPDSRKGRMSLPLFLHPRSDVVLSERHTAGTYLEERLRELRVV
ncbi:MAG: 2OG-Fe(II) oxygenase family protein [Pseudomonadota bacterium]